MKVGWDDAKVMNRIDFENLFRAALQNNFFNFEGKAYKQIDEDAMRSRLGPTLVNACFHEKIWLNECPDEFKPAYYKTYVDDIFVLLCSPDHLQKFKSYLNSKRKIPDSPVRKNRITLYLF